ncbi:uncharacterized protein LOC100825094 isoform X2 [Brachypodium distachyon]|nr:uncharacterized protein LOC100825094 isoform X2 [Brachypodium distachyon]|eukprot:XP_014754930.1 uncharacterized protein LOC100825094 isoform X2 [Brachypodium distachyon]
MRTLIAEQTNCKGNFPTIAELEKMITPGLGGDLFKRVFLMFVLATFICPSSHGAASPEYYHALEDPDNIASFDWCTAALDKLVLSIENWQKAGTSVLGGNLLSIVILYFEFIDINIMKATTTLPRLSLWTTQMISEYERMDCMSFPLQIYGKLPVKDVSQTPFSMDILNRNILLQGNSYREFQQFIMSAVPQQNQKMVINEIPRIMDNLYTEILASIQPVVTKNIIQMVKLFSSAAAALPAEDPAQHAETMANLNEIKTPMKPWCSHSSAFETPGVSSAENAIIQSNSQPRVESAKQEAMHLNTQPGVEAMEHELVQLPKSTSLKDTSVGSLDKKDTSLTTNILDDLMKESVQLPEIRSEELCKLDNEYSIIPDLGNLIHFCDEIPVPVCLDLPPPNREIIDSMLPERIDITMSHTESSESFNLASYVSLDTQCYWESHWERRNAEGIGASRIDKTELFPGCKEASCDLDSSFDGQKESLQHGSTSTKACTVKDRKRSTCVSLNEMSASCIAPKKRIKMFEGNDATPTELVSNKASTPFGHNVVDDSWNDEETMSEILKSSDLLAKEYYAQKQLARQPAKEFKYLK